MPIQRFSTASLNCIRQRFQSVCDDLSKELGLGITLGNIRFSETTATLKVNLVTSGENGEIKSKEAIDFIRYAHSHGIPVSCLGKIFSNTNGDELILLGYMPRSYAYPFLAERTYDKKRYKFPKTAIQIGFKLLTHSSPEIPA